MSMDDDDHLSSDSTIRLSPALHLKKKNKSAPSYIFTMQIYPVGHFDICQALTIII